MKQLGIFIVVALVIFGIVAGIWGFNQYQTLKAENEQLAAQAEEEAAEQEFEASIAGENEIVQDGVSQCETVYGRMVEGIQNMTIYGIPDSSSPLQSNYTGNLIVPNELYFNTGIDTSTGEVFARFGLYPSGTEAWLKISDLQGYSNLYNCLIALSGQGGGFEAQVEGIPTVETGFSGVPDGQFPSGCATNWGYFSYTDLDSGESLTTANGIALAVSKTPAQQTGDWQILQPNSSFTAPAYDVTTVYQYYCDEAHTTLIAFNTSTVDSLADAAQAGNSGYRNIGTLGQ